MCCAYRTNKLKKIKQYFFIADVFADSWKWRSQKMNINETRILHLTNVMGIGGVEKIIYEICLGTKNDFKNIIVASTGGEYAERLVQLGIKHESIPDITTNNIYEVFKLKKKLKEIITENKINLIHCHHRRAVLYAKLLFPHIKIVYSNHTIYTDKKIMTRFILRGIELIADGVQAKLNLTQYFGLNDANIAVINNAVEKDGSKFTGIPEIEKQRNNGQFIVMNCSRLNREKGVEYFIDAANVLCKKGLNIKFFIVGDGSEKECLKKKVSEHKLEKDVFFLGFRNDIKNTIKNADLIVLTSIREGLPLTPMEAFSVKKTIVATDINGTKEVVHDGINGLLAISENADSIADKIEYFYYDRTELESFNERAYESFCNEFCAEVMVEKYRKYYGSL